MFPFLIGRIRTSSGLSGSSNGSEFPFLIGRIRTEKQEALIDAEKCFHSS